MMEKIASRPHGCAPESCVFGRSANHFRGFADQDPLSLALGGIFATKLRIFTDNVHLDSSAPRSLLQ
jgi:hypothetical protein